MCSRFKRCNKHLLAPFKIWHTLLSNFPFLFSTFFSSSFCPFENIWCISKPQRNKVKKNPSYTKPSAFHSCIQQALCSPPQLWACVCLTELCQLGGTVCKRRFFFYFCPCLCASICVCALSLKFNLLRGKKRHLNPQKKAVRVPVLNMEKRHQSTLQFHFTNAFVKTSMLTG